MALVEHHAFDSEISRITMPASELCKKVSQPHFVFPQRLEHKWKSLYEADFNGAAQDTAATQLQLCAATLAGCWKELYRCRLEQDREVRNALRVCTLSRCHASRWHPPSCSPPVCVSHVHV